MEKKENLASSTTAETKKMVLGLLHDLGCEPFDASDDCIKVYYHGEGFVIFINERYVRIWDPAWSHVSTDSQDIFLIIEAINFTNTQCRPTVVMSEMDENEIVHIHCRFYLPLYPSCSDNLEIFRDALESFFTTKQFLKECSYKIFVGYVKKMKQEKE